jgi:hypothetical protein
MFVEGEFLDTVIGIPHSRTEIVMLRPPDGGTRLELSSFVRPDPEPGSPAAMANELGLRNVAFEVDDLQAAVDRLATDGTDLSAASASTNTSGAWPTCADPRGSPCLWPSASADAPPTRYQPDVRRMLLRPLPSGSECNGERTAVRCVRAEGSEDLSGFVGCTQRHDRGADTVA